jgi:oligopeptide transport system substrate-binding protein
MSRNRLQLMALLGAVGLMIIACGGNQAGGGGETLAADQTLRWPMVDDVGTLDPGHVSLATDVPYVQEMFSGLYRFDSHNKVVPDLASAAPDVSSDGKTFTVKLRKEAKFSNGDPLTSKDVLYSWNRGAKLNDAYASTFDPIMGGRDVENQAAQSMSGLTAPDDQTVKIQLTDPAGYFLSSIALPVAGWIVDQKAIQQGGEDAWWTKPETAVGSGPFKLTSRAPKSSMEFAPVANWWGGSTGAIKKVHVDTGIDQSSALKKFESNGFDLIGMANQSPSPDDILRYKSDPTKSKLQTLYPSARSTYMGFNFVKGPFAPKSQVTPGDPTSGLSSDAGKDGRAAFSQAIDRDQLVDVACAKGATCSKATGGYIAKGLKGYLGDNQDPTAKFDAATAKAQYQKWDPDGSKVKGLQLRYNSSAVNNQVWSNVQSQLQATLGVKVELAPSDGPTLIKDRKAKNAIIFRDSWLADYDHPQDWFDNLWICGQAGLGKGNSEGYCNPAMDNIVQKADTQSVDTAIPAYKQAQMLMIQDVVGANLFYSVQPYVLQPYVKGAGYTGLQDYRWEDIRLLKH